MSFVCPSCGHLDFDPRKQCVCGYCADESFFSGSSARKDGKIKGKGTEPLMRPKEKPPAKELVIKEIDSWQFSFSEVENCIYLSTPALQSFRLKLDLNDLEELLEFIYQKTGKEKTTRKLRLSAEGIADLVDRVHVMIEEKRAKVPVKLNDNDLEQISDLINTKLKE